MLRNTPVLVLDESVSQLDVLSEQEVTEALDAVRAERTTVIIAHRLSTIRAADRIIVLDGGQVAADGRPDELLRTSPTYATLIQTQLDAADRITHHGP